MPNDYNQFINLEYFFYKIYQFFAWIFSFFTGSQSGGEGSFWEQLLRYGNFFKAIVELLVVLFLIGIIYSLIRVYEINKEERRKLSKILAIIDDATVHNERWEAILRQVDSDNSGDWRLAIIEADNMLDDMVKQLGYDGEDLGERLKAVEPSDFFSLQSAWEAHKIRNQIVHEGASFQITKAEAERVIDLYKEIFKEFEYI
ncbi:MAG: hypothetical protein AAB428_02950 [Patescibacteria group bacterium]